MDSPFLKNPVEIGAQIIRRPLRRERTFKDRHNPLAFSNEDLFERYRFSADDIVHLCRLLEPHIKNITRRSHALNMTCDQVWIVTSLDNRWPGSVHDSRIFRESVLGQRFEEGIKRGGKSHYVSHKCLHLYHMCTFVMNICTVCGYLCFEFNMYFNLCILNVYICFGLNVYFEYLYFDIYLSCVLQVYSCILNSIYANKCAYLY
ncbi:hypothetical protein DPX16_3455 [Anabarilius grahami]|uniref:DDE Tnp4 domain-containing protein n=1 Tax=Anabarilius grahami TaxID=495550 RepID=A0A3N0XKK8_ANAGA|nr:hypothetical protein DPX16_3455 [Anabarilius grahami]